MPTAITVTATQGGSTHAGMALRVLVLTQAASVQNGGTAAAHFASTTSFTLSVTTTQTGSRVYGAICASVNQSATAAAATTVIDNIADANEPARYNTFKATSLTGTPGATTLGVTYASAAFGVLAQAEILTAGTLTEDGSAPAVVSTTTATTLTTASFTPPDGSLLVALVPAFGGASVETMTVSGGGLTWTELVKRNGSGEDYAGVWIAQVPAVSAFVPWQPPRRLPYRTPALPPVRRYRSLLPVPHQLNPPFQFNETVQRRQAWPRGLPRRGRVTFAVPPQLNPPYPFTETVQRRETWARGLPRRGRQVTPVPPQLNPPYPFAETRQWRQPRGFWPFRGRRFEVVPAQQAAAGAPAFTWQPLRHARIMLSRRGRAPVVVPGQDAPVPQARRVRPALPTRRPYRQTLPVPPQLNPPYPFAEVAQRRETWARALLRRGRLMLPWPQAAAPVLQDGDVVATVTERTATAATLTEGTTTTATVADAATSAATVTEGTTMTATVADQASTTASVT